ncbi:integral membrane protein [Rutstroemia sp. NJR-2017a WRK4]|nr:integral membrane protein [Rutstroemia sp. NJR-2017a WRK4]
MNLVTDVALIGLPLLIVYKLQMSLKKKVTVLSCFGARSFRELHADNITRDIWPWILCAQLMQTTSIITSCIPYLRPLLEAFPSGMLVNDDISRQRISSQHAEGYTKPPDYSYVLRDVSKNTISNSQFRSTEIEINDPENNVLPDSSGQSFRNKSHGAYAGDETSIADNQSHHSSEKSQSRIIKDTSTIEDV